MTPHVWTPALDAVIIRMIGEGKSWADVAAVLKFTSSSVRCRGQRIGVKMGKTHLSARLSAAVKASWTPERRAFQSKLIKERRIWEGGCIAIAAGGAEVANRRIASVIAAKERWWDWCPVPYRAQYRLLSSNGFTPTEARRIVVDDIARDDRRAATAAAAIKATADRADALHAFLTRHDRDVAAAKAGTATFVERVFMPSTVPQFSAASSLS